nr:hypothetical protein [Tanacetum cinerariifolium]
MCSFKSMPAKLRTRAFGLTSLTSGNKWEVKLDLSLISKQLRIVLSFEDKLNYLEHPIPAALVPAHAEIQRNLENLCAYKMLHELKTLFDQQAERELLHDRLIISYKNKIKRKK